MQLSPAEKMALDSQARMWERSAAREKARLAQSDRMWRETLAKCKRDGHEHGTDGVCWRCGNKQA